MGVQNLCLPLSVNSLSKPLHIAALAGHAIVVDALLKRGADVKSITEQGQTPLHLACMGGHVAVVKLLLKEGADPDGYLGDNSIISSPIHLACSAGASDCVRELIQAGCCINSIDQEGFTPLHCASIVGSVECVEELIEAGAKIDVRDHKDRNALACAIQGGHPKVAFILTCNKDSCKYFEPIEEPQQLWIVLDSIDRMIEAGGGKVATFGSEIAALEWACSGGGGTWTSQQTHIRSLRVQAIAPSKYAAFCADIPHVLLARGDQQTYVTQDKIEAAQNELKQLLIQRDAVLQADAVLHYNIKALRAALQAATENIAFAEPLEVTPKSEIGAGDFAGGGGVNS